MEVYPNAGGVRTTRPASINPVRLAFPDLIFLTVDGGGFVHDKAMDPLVGSRVAVVGLQ